MFSSIYARLTSPFPFRYSLGTFIIPALLVFSILLFLSPLFNKNLSLPNRVLLGLTFSLITVFCSAACVFSIHFLRMKMKWYSWKLWHEVNLNIGIIILIGVGNIVGVTVLKGGEMSLELASLLLLLTLKVGIIPIAIVSLYEQNWYLKKINQISTLRLQLNQQRFTSAVDNSKRSFKSISISNENGITELQLSQEELLYVHSDGNYLDVYYTTKSSKEILRKTIRNRLKNLLEQLPKDTLLLVHRSYAVNILHLDSINGNSRNAHLLLKDVQDEIPISRSKYATIMALIEEIDQRN